MVLNFFGGVKLPPRSEDMQKDIIEYPDCSAVCFKINPGAKAEYAVPFDFTVKKGTLIAEINGTPIYSSVSGVFHGKTEISGADYLVVSSDGKNIAENPFPAESRAISDISPEEMVGLAKKYSVTETRSGKKLWKLLNKCLGKCQRVIIDCTEPDSESTINSALCSAFAKEIVYGAKMLIHTGSAPKCVFAYTKSTESAVKNIKAEISGAEELFAFAEISEKYPIDDRALISAIYVKELAYGETAADMGYLAVSAETAKAFYRCVSRGEVHTDRYISVCGRGFGEEKNIKVPAGITLHDIVDICGGLKRGFIPISDSRINGEKVYGALDDGTRAVISVKPRSKKSYECSFCMECVSACPMRLIPLRAITGKTDDTLYRNCTECGACEYICPSGIPLMSLIRDGHPYENDDESGETDL